MKEELKKIELKAVPSTGPVVRSIGKITRFDLRDLWPHEAFDFSKWLQENLDTLNEALDLELDLAQREKAAGEFSCDLIAQDRSLGRVIIENQLERSNHDHLGKVLVYLTALEAEVAIWIVSEARPEHVKVISYLNESTTQKFFLVKVDAVRIGDSEPAALFTKIVGPSEEISAIGEAKKESAEQGDRLFRFWSMLLKDASEKTDLHSNISPGRHQWVGTSTGVRGVNYNYSVTQDASRVEIYIDRGKGNDEENKRIFEQLFSQKDSIERDFGSQLVWEPLPGARACRIKFEFSGGYVGEEEWPTTRTQMIDAMVRLEKAFKKPISNLRIEK